MKNLKHPAFIMAVIGVVCLLVGLGMMGSADRTGHYIMYAGMALGGIFWFWTIGRVITASDLKPFQKRFWLISVIAVPVVGAMVFHVLHQQSDKITT